MTVTIEDQVNRRIELLHNYCFYCRTDEPSRGVLDLRINQGRALANADEIAAKGNKIQRDIAHSFIYNCSSSEGTCEAAISNYLESLIRTTTKIEDIKEEPKTEHWIKEEINSERNSRNKLHIPLD